MLLDFTQHLKINDLIVLISILMSEIKTVVEIQSLTKTCFLIDVHDLSYDYQTFGDYAIVFIHSVTHDFRDNRT